VSGFDIPAALEGFLLGASLIVAIGAQNAFVLRQGLLRRHVFPVATLCAASDALLIVAGVAGLGALVRDNGAALTVIALGGAAFLFAYGLMAFRRALRPGSLEASRQGAGSLARSLATALALTFLNPHVYLDTVVLIGGLSARHAGMGAVAFGVGAALASVVWFYSLGFGARLLAPVFARPAAWRLLDVAIGVVMWAIAIRLLLGAGLGSDTS
jgi:L-lysine exporter family protein LysE/ArgO